jgi:hypothetical protein
MKRVLKLEADVEMKNCIKSKVYGQLGIQLKEIKSRENKLNFG